MPLGTEVDLGPDVLDGDPAPPKKRAQQPPLFGRGLNFPALHRNCFSQLHFHFSHQSTIYKPPINTTKCPQNMYRSLPKFNQLFSRSNEHAPFELFN